MDDALEFIARILWYGGLPFAIAFGAILLFRSTLAPRRRLLVAALSFLSILSFCFLFSMSVLLRDGMAPGFVPSDGLEAAIRVAPGAILSLLVGGGFAIVGYWVARRGKITTRAT